MPISSVAAFWISFFGGGILGGIVSASLTYLFNRRLAAANRQHQKLSSQDDRKRNFRGFISEFRSWAERTPHQDAGTAFGDKIHSLRNESTRIQEDVPDRKRFEELVTALCRLTANDVSQYKKEDDRVTYIGRDRVCTAIDSIVASLD